MQLVKGFCLECTIIFFCLFVCLAFEVKIINLLLRFMENTLQKKSLENSLR